MPLDLRIRTLKDLKQKTTTNMTCSKVLILTLFIFGTFAKDTIENMEERIEALEGKLVALTKAHEMDHIETNKQFKAIEKKHRKDDIENNKQIKVIKKKLAALTKAIEMEDDASTLANIENTLTGLVSTVETNAEQIKMLNAKVIFSGRKTEIAWGAIKAMTFDQVDINIGDAFDGSIFTVPISGIYKMTFSGQSGHQIAIMVDVNKPEKAFYIHDGEKTDGVSHLNNVSYTWMMKLVEGDKVELISDDPLYASSDIPLTFTGELIHIEN